MYTYSLSVHYIIIVHARSLFFCIKEKGFFALSLTLAFEIKNQKTENRNSKRINIYCTLMSVHLMLQCTISGRCPSLLSGGILSIGKSGRFSGIGAECLGGFAVMLVASKLRLAFRHGDCGDAGHAWESLVA